MRRAVLSALITFWAAAVWPAAAGPEIPAAALNKKGKLLGADRARYLLRQLDLSEAQAARARELLDTTLTGADAAPLNIDEVRTLWTQIEKAKKAGNQQKVDALTEQLQHLSRDATGDAEFFMNFEPELTDAQKKILGQARARLKGNPGGGLRPIDLMRVASSFDLSGEQRVALRAAHAATRKEIGPLLRLNQKQELRVLNFCAEQLRALLTPEQRSRFELHICALRPDLIGAGLRVSLSDASSAATGEKAASPNE